MRLEEDGLDELGLCVILFLMVIGICLLLLLIYALS